MNSSFSVPDCFISDNTPDENTDAIRSAMPNVLENCNEENTLGTARMLIHPIEIARWDLTFAFVLYKLLI